MLLENCQTAGEYFDYLIAQLTDLYGLREARTITTYLFEDLFQPMDEVSAQRYWSVEERQLFERVLSELRQKRPWQYVVGVADFYGLKFRVDESVLIPRPETEELVHHVIQQQGSRVVDVLDVGTGSGCIAITLKKNMPQATVTALDCSSKALELAQQNALANITEVFFLELDILDPLAAIQLPLYDIIISNPPYIRLEERPMMTDNVLFYEPDLALYVTNDDPLQFYRILASLGKDKLHSGGWLYLEINERYGPDILALLKAEQYQHCVLHQDMYGRDRIVAAQYVAS